MDLCGSFISHLGILGCNYAVFNLVVATHERKHDRLQNRVNTGKIAGSPIVLCQNDLRNNHTISNCKILNMSPRSCVGMYASLISFNVEYLQPPQTGPYSKIVFQSLQVEDDILLKGLAPFPSPPSPTTLLANDASPSLSIMHLHVCKP